MWEKQCDSSSGNTNQTKTGYHLRLVRMAILKKSRDNKCLQQCG